MNTIQNKFDSITVIENVPYINSVSLVNIYKRLSGKSGTTQNKLVNELKLTNCLIVLKRSKDPTKIGTVISKIIDNFKSQIHHIYISVDELLQPKEGPNKQNHIRLLQLITDMPDVAVTAPVASATSAMEATPATHVVAPATTNIVAAPESEINHTRTMMSIIQLEEHEMFRDANDQVFPIEVRGQRSKDKILFKAKDIADYFEIKEFIKIMMKGHTSFKYNSDYVVLEANDNTLYMIQNLGENSMGTLYPLNSSINGRGINHDLVYLTLSGLIRTATISRSGNANMNKVFDWIVNLCYVHQFGSSSERSAMAQSLFKIVLNDKMAGLYYIDLGTCNDLYDKMNIDAEQYPPHIYGSYRIGKFGLSEDISARISQHKNKKNGYGQWCNELLSPSQLAKAEVILSNLLRANSFAFEYTDASGKSHNELIMFDPAKEHKVKKIYRQVMDLYPSKENELYKIMDEATYKYESEINQLRSENKIDKLESTIQIQSLSHQVEMLSLKLEMSRYNQ